MTAVPFVHTVRHIQSDCSSLHPHCSCSLYSAMTVALYVHTARVSHIRSDCCYLRPHCLCLLNTRSECCSLYIPMQLSRISKSQCPFASPSRNCRLCTETLQRTQLSFRTVSVPHPSRYKSRSMRNSTTALETHYHYYDEASMRQTATPQKNIP